MRPRGRGIRDTKFDVSATHRPCDRLIATRRRTGRAPALAKAACNNGGPDVAGTADIGLVQGVSGAASNGDFIDHLRITNYGPCNVPNVGLVAALPGNLVAFSSNPASWTCTGIGSLTATCSETSTIGVPGTADIYLEYVSTPGLITACAATFSTPLSLATCPNWNGAPPDPNPSNNGSTIAGAVLGANGTLTYGPNGQPNPSSLNGSLRAEPLEVHERERGHRLHDRGGRHAGQRDDRRLGDSGRGRGPFGPARAFGRVPEMTGKALEAIAQRDSRPIGLSQIH